MNKKQKKKENIMINVQVDLGMKFLCIYIYNFIPL